MEQKLEKCIKARLVGQGADEGYTTYVFENLNTGDFVMCSRCPNWRGDEPRVMQDGYVEFKDVKGGVDTYFEASSGQHKFYQYTATYFLNFVPITHVLKNGFVTNTNQLKVS